MMTNPLPAIWRLHLLLAASIFFTPTVQALPRTGLLPKGWGSISTQMLGGRYASISRGPYALIVMENEADGASCSGILVGPREVLTAAHCVKSPPNEVQFIPSEYTVIVGGQQVGVTATAFNPAYDPEAEVDDESSQYDLGMLVLDTPITSVNPVPVLLNEPLQGGDVDTLYGFGTNESSDDPNGTLLEQGKYGSITIDYVGNGVFHSYFGDSEAASCAGDSGGGVVRKRGSFTSVVGVVSAGTTGTTNAGACFSTGDDDDSIFVDLQTETSLAFLSGFPDVQYASGPLINFKVKVDGILPKIKSAQKLRSLSALKKQSNAAVKTLSALQPGATESRAGKLSEAIEAFRSVKSFRGFSQANSYAKQGVAALKVLSALGAN